MGLSQFCKKYKITNYTITPEGVDVHEAVDLSHCKLIELPIQFNVIHGNFTCSGYLESLRNAPRVVHGYFSCAGNKLQSLEFVPKFIQGVFYCNCNKISPWEHRYLLFSEIKGRIQTNSYELNAFFRKYQNQKSGIPQALKELRLLQIKWVQNA